MFDLSFDWYGLVAGDCGRFGLVCGSNGVCGCLDWFGYFAVVGSLVCWLLCGLDFVGLF